MNNKNIFIFFERMKNCYKYLLLLLLDFILLSKVGLEFKKCSFCPLTDCSFMRITLMVEF